MQPLQAAVYFGSFDFHGDFITGDGLIIWDFLLRTLLKLKMLPLLRVPVQGGDGEQLPDCFVPVLSLGLPVSVSGLMQFSVSSFPDPRPG